VITGALTQVAQPGTEDWVAFFRDSEGNLVGLVERRPASHG
jgi:hypothetical protein